MWRRRFLRLRSAGFEPQNGYLRYVVAALHRPVNALPRVAGWLPGADGGQAPMRLRLRPAPPNAGSDGGKPPVPTAYRRKRYNGACGKDEIPLDAPFLTAVDQSRSFQKMILAIIAIMYDDNPSHVGHSRVRA
jgi:hypothetical protein